MFPGSSFDPSYIILLLLGKDNSWIPLIIIIVVIFQKWSSIIDLYNTNVCTYGKTQYKVSGTFYINFEDECLFAFYHLYIYAESNKNKPIV